jgi:hypothetical protein
MVGRRVYIVFPIGKAHGSLDKCMQAEMMYIAVT